MTQDPAPIEPDTKDWTVVIADGCTECGYRPHDVRATSELIRATIAPWRDRLAQADVTERPEPTVWAPVEYGAHVRDVCTVFRQRLELMLTEDDPMFADWDQDAAAVDGDYLRQSPPDVAAQYAGEAEQLAAAFDQVGDDQWQRPSRRSNGSAFTVETFARYLVHDLHHHLHDVTK